MDNLSGYKSILTTVRNTRGNKIFIDTVRNIQVSEIPRFSWTTEPGTGDITVTAETAPLSVHVWHASTCNTERR